MAQPVPLNLNSNQTRDSVKYGLYESLALDCDHEIVIENPINKFVMQIWCEECLTQHSFGLVLFMETIEELWEFLKEDD